MYDQTRLFGKQFAKCLDCKEYYYSQWHILNDVPDSAKKFLKLHQNPEANNMMKLGTLPKARVEDVLVQA